MVGFTANVSLDSVMVMMGIVPSRFSHQLVKDSGCFVINLPKKSFKKEYDYLGSKSGRDGQSFEWKFLGEDGMRVPDGRYFKVNRKTRKTKI